MNALLEGVAYLEPILVRDGFEEWIVKTTCPALSTFIKRHMGFIDRQGDLVRTMFEYTWKTNFCALAHDGS
jgi:hypothetical protein